MIKKEDVSGFLAFFKFPKQFLYDEQYKKLSNDAKFLYMLLFDRLELSLKNGWHDKDGNVFQYYTNEQLTLDLGRSEKTVIRLKKELKEIGLLEEVRQGVNLPNRIYINTVSGTVNFTGQELTNLQSGTEKSSALDLKKVQTIKTDNIKTENNNNNMSFLHKEIIDFLNEKVDGSFRHQTKVTQRLINARFKQGYTVEDFKMVITFMAKEWLNDPKMDKYLTPSTLFNETNFEKYLRNAKKHLATQDNTPDERLGF